MNISRINGQRVRGTPEREHSVWIGFLVKRCGQTTVVAWSDALVFRALRIERRLNE